ncbi:single-stranded DNA binding protein [Cyanophage S-RIM12_W1_24_0910]|uniref:Single-stranded DNA binding protein n=2 Tax=Brizovirus TaxID=2733098 RepID=A0A1D7SZW3_9CAUD|nr:UvsY-like recombination mediator [Cyanophage S-RIM12 isolate RW_01_0310]AOO15822.1 single-stranded DNA binding protein [Cyanophage S-RIM12 isolate RW_01_0310]AOO18185.1 single-stranded DNA binding protein [Cyanophage S-RIM12_Sn_07_0910]AOO19042.1 single-stranded DNA binding protein [Cyanophage S-RIM12_W1_24_0910]
MNLESLQEMWKTDSVLDDDLHDNDSLKIPQLHAKYMEYYNTFSLMKSEREIELNRITREKWLYYKGKAPAAIYKEMPFDLKLTTKEEISMFIAADEDIGKIQYKIGYITQVLCFLDGVLRQINNRSFHIKNAIEWKRFQSGM